MTPDDQDAKKRIGPYRKGSHLWTAKADDRSVAQRQQTKRKRFEDLVRRTMFKHR